jgi:hypothetical protein
MADAPDLGIVVSESERRIPTKPATPPAPLTAVYHKGRVFEVPAQEYCSMRDNQRDAICDRAEELGLTVYSKRSHGCIYCRHSPKNLTILMQQQLPRVIIDENTDVAGKCGFHCDDTKTAGLCTHHITGIRYMAQPFPCAFDIAGAQVLVEKGLLDTYEVARPFDYPTLEQLDNDATVRRRFRVDGNDSTPMRWWRRLLDMFYRCKMVS